MNIDHIHFYVESAKEWRDWFVRVMGFQSIASSINSHTLTEIVSNGFDRERGSVIFVLSSALNSSSPIAHFLDKHPCGVADVAFRVDDLESIIQKLPNKIEIQEFFYPNGQLKYCQTSHQANLKHTLVERQGITPILPYTPLIKPISTQKISRIIGIDHVVLNVFAGQLEKTANWYEEVLGFQRKQAFTIQTERSGLYSQVMIHPLSGVQLPINEPRGKNSQIQEFLEINKGEGIQHIALKTRQILQLTQQLRDSGLSFLTVPENYYQQLKNKDSDLKFLSHEWQEIQKKEVLIDFEIEYSLENNNRKPTLLQIFTKPIFEQPTFFFELIERRNEAKGFGEGNFQALFKAIEREQVKRENIIDSVIDEPIQIP